MRRPKGVKTRKSVGKRFKITGTGKVMCRGAGKVMCRGAGKRHLLANKSPKRRRSIRQARVVGPTDVYRVLQNLPFSH